MANIPTTTDDETTERISNIIHQHLAERFTGEFSFGPVLPVIRTDYQEGIDYPEIYIAFDGDQDDLDARWTLGLPDRIHPQLVELGFPNMALTSWVHASEWDDLIAIARALAAGAVSPQTGRPRRAGTEPSSQYHLLRSVPHPGQQQRQHTHRLRFPGPQRSGMGVGLPDHRPPVSTSALPAPRHVPIPGPNQRDGRSLRRIAGKKAPSRLRAPSAKSQIPSPPVGDGDRGGHQSL